jgi:hypothetical protein
MSRNSAISIAAGHGLTVRGSNPGRHKDFLFSKIVHTDSGAHLALYSMCTRLFSGVKRLEREVDHLTSYSAKIKNEWRCTSNPPIYLHGMD